MANSRYNDFTYGRNAFSSAEDELAAGQTHGTYGALLFDKRWVARRQEILMRDDYKCLVCKCTGGLQVHHRQYHFIKGLKQFKAPWDYPGYLMITLCEKCHTRGHVKYKIPTIYL